MVNELLDSDIIGVDSEWKPIIAKMDKSRPALL